MYHIIFASVLGHVIITWKGYTQDLQCPTLCSNQLYSFLQWVKSLTLKYLSNDKKQKNLKQVMSFSQNNTGKAFRYVSLIVAVSHQ